MQAAYSSPGLKAGLRLAQILRMVVHLLVEAKRRILCRAHWGRSQALFFVGGLVRNPRVWQMDREPPRPKGKISPIALGARTLRHMELQAQKLQVPGL